MSATDAPDSAAAAVPHVAGRPETGLLPGAGHRERLLDAMAASIREHGYRGTTVADVVRRARTSRRTFYQHFDDREAIFLALFDESGVFLSARIAQALEPDAPWEEQVEQTVGAYMDEVAAEPELAIAFTRELTALGEVGVARQRREMETFAELLMALVAVVAEHNPSVAPMSKGTAILITGGLRELSAYSIEAGEPLASMKTQAVGLIKSVLDPAHRGWSESGSAD